MDISKIFTLTGMALKDAIAKLDEQLPADAYSAVPGGADLTDIDPNYMRKVLNAIYGLCGFGWGYEYLPTDLDIRQETRKTNSGSREVIVATLKHLRFWYKVTDGTETFVCTVDASGGSDNSNAAYAMKGAITNAIGNAVSNIGFQESVYLGKRSHKTVKASASKPAPSAAKATLPAKPAAKPADEIEEIEPVAAKTILCPEEEFVIEFGSRKTHKLSEFDNNIVGWYATQLVTGGDEKKEALKKAASAVIAARGKNNGHAPQSTAA
jgi:hypothetical protein